MIIDYKEGEEPQNDESENNERVADSLGGTLRNRFEEWSDARKDIEDDWVKDLRAFNAQYDEDTQARLSADPNRSQIYVRLTREKTMAAYSRIIDLLFPSGDMPWSIEPTSVPEMMDEPSIIELNQKAMFEVEAIMQQLQAEGGELQIDPMELAKQRVAEVMEEAAAESRKIAKKRAELMTLEMKDQLEELNYEGVYKKAIMESCMLGTGCVKGSTVKVENKQRWSETPDGWTMSSEEIAKPNIEYVSIFDVYPDPYAIDLSDLSGVFHRHVMTKHQFRALKKMTGFSTENIDEIVSDNPDGNHVEETHEQSRRHIAGQLMKTTSNRYEVIEWWGLVDGLELQKAGLEIEDETEEYEANVWICGSKVIRARLNPHQGGELPYQLFPYERTPHQLWGTGVPKMMRDSQDTINAAVRIFIDNQAISSGPQVEVNTNMLPAGADVTDIHPWKIWLREGGDSATPMLRFYQPQNVSQHLTTVIELFRRFADEETSMPSYSHGQNTPGMTKTASGISMMMGAASIAVKSIIKNIDDYLTRPLIVSLYNWNMRWNIKEEIKGDMKIVARGSTALLAKEVQSQRLIQFAQMTTNEVDLPLTDRRVVLGEVARSLDLDPDKFMPVPDDESMQAQEARQTADDQMREAHMEAEMAEQAATIAKLQAQAKREQSQAMLNMVDAETLPAEREAEAARDRAYAAQTVQSVQQGKTPDGFSQ